MWPLYPTLPPQQPQSDLGRVLDLIEQHKKEVERLKEDLNYEKQQTETWGRLRDDADRVATEAKAKLFNAELHAEKRLYKALHDAIQPACKKMPADIAKKIERVFKRVYSAYNIGAKEKKEA